MPVRIIDHKRVDISDDEYKLYKQICRSYDDEQGKRKGEDLFTDHFEVNSEGIIIFVKPPTKRYSSMEIYCFLSSLMLNQHLRLMHEQCDALVNDTKNKVREILDSYKKMVETDGDDSSNMNEPG